MRLLRGKKIANVILSDIRKKIKNRKLKPTLAVVLIGKNRASELYVKLKARAAKKVGMKLVLYKFKSGAKEKDIIKLIRLLDKDEKINGIIVQLPLPKKYQTQKIINAIDPGKDADGFHPGNIKKFLAGKNEIASVFPMAIMKMINFVETRLIASPQGKKAIIIANSEIFGKTMKAALAGKKIKAQILLRLNPHRLKAADIVITAVGKPKFIKGSMIKKGAIIIDGGITKRGKKVLGDVDFNSVADIAGYLSPVPGGVGPVTVACLLENVCRLSLAQGRGK